ncbi:MULTISPECIES: alpha/beta fold hydrolase [unclassified Aeromicrobium]|uniref:alpha/beta hydrolase n=1 Tax=unclassified Aeromicrobium TaxID=2633570 RepID=UPI00288A27AF|nr:MULTISPECIES: alpha/beta fold hydrolase [unclassified Aeromicrobium]
MDAEQRSGRLDDVHVPQRPRAVVLMLHGGRQQSEEPVRNRHASWWRMALLSKAFARTARREHLAVHLLQYRARGWNDAARPWPVADARSALSELRERHGDLPVVLVGHSMGGRTACRAADDPSVVGVVALAPWLPQGEPVGALSGRALHVLHGTMDRWTSARLSADYVERARRVATEATWESLAGAGHYMFRRVRAWNAFVEDSVLRIVGARADGRHDHDDDATRGPA